MFVSERVLKELLNTFYRGAVVILVLELCAGLSKHDEISKIWPLMSSGDLTFDLTSLFVRPLACRLPRVATWPRSWFRWGDRTQLAPSTDPVRFNLNWAKNQPTIVKNDVYRSQKPVGCIGRRIFFHNFTIPPPRIAWQWPSMAYGLSLHKKMSNTCYIIHTHATFYNQHMS